MSRPQVRFLDRSTPPHILTLVLLSGLSALAMNIFLPSLPRMAEWFGTDYGVMQLSVSLYLAMNAIVQIIIGPISDRFGRRPVVLASLVLFLLATLGTLIAPTAEIFLVFRMCQSAIVAAMVLSRAVVRDMVGEAEAASMIGYVTMAMALVPMLSPMLGGILDFVFGWQSNFIVMAICAVAVLAVTWADLGETARGRSGGFRAQVAEYPALLASRRFWGYVAAAALSSGAFFSFVGGAPFVGMQVYGLSPAMLGLYFGFPSIGYALGNFLTGRYSMRFGIDRMMLAGAIIASSGLTGLTVVCLIGLPPPVIFFGFFVFVGLGNGMVLPNATSGMLSVRPQLAATASGLGGAIMLGIGAALSALVGSMLVPGAGHWPLTLMMLGSTVLGFMAALYVMGRQKQVRR